MDRHRGRRAGAPGGRRISTYSDREGLNHNYVRSIYEDREGNLWVGTNGGLNQLRDGKVATYTTREGLAADFARVVLEDARGDIWVGTDGGGLCRFRDGGFTCIGTADGLPSASVRALGLGRDGALWVGTRGGLSRLDGSTFTNLSTRDGLSSNLVRAVLEDRKGIVWVGTEGGGLNRIRGWPRSRPSRLLTVSPSNDVRALYEGRDGDAVDRHLRGPGALGGWRFSGPTAPPDGLPNDIVFAITEDRHGNLWIGTDGGLALIEPSHITAFTIDDGLHDNKVFQILEDDAGYLWMSSNRGISRVRVDDLYARAAGQLARLEVQELRPLRRDEGQPVQRRLATGRLAHAGRGAVVPDRRGRGGGQSGEHALQPAAAAGVDRGGRGERRPLGADPVRELPPGTRELELHYTALSFVAPEKVRFRYRLEGFDPRWVEAGGRRTAYYTNVPPGRYRFRVLACNNDGVWNETGASWVFAIRAPLWQRWWAYLLYWSWPPGPSPWE